LEQEHVIVSYNNDLRGMIEDQFGRERRIKCSVASFAGVGAIVDGGRLVATLPILIATQILRVRPHLKMAELPFPHEPGSIELLWPKALELDPACHFVRGAIVEIASRLQLRPQPRRSAKS